MVLSQRRICRSGMTQNDISSRVCARPQRWIDPIQAYNELPVEPVELSTHCQPWSYVCTAHESKHGGRGNNKRSRKTHKHNLQSLLLTAESGSEAVPACWAGTFQKSRCVTHKRTYRKRSKKESERAPTWFSAMAAGSGQEPRVHVGDGACSYRSMAARDQRALTWRHPHPSGHRLWDSGPAHVWVKEGSKGWLRMFGGAGFLCVLAHR